MKQEEQTRHTAGHTSEPAFGHPPATQQQEAYSTTSDAQNRAAQASHAAAHHAEADQNLSKTKSKRIDDDNLKKLVAEENADRGKFPRYPGLERWQLLEKMGDGAFSNVYRARDLQENAGEVAIKVVRKFEMNNMQVREALGDNQADYVQPGSFLQPRTSSSRRSFDFPPFCAAPPLALLLFLVVISFFFTNSRDCSRGTISTRTSSQRFPEQQRRETFFPPPFLLLVMLAFCYNCKHCRQAIC